MEIGSHALRESMDRAREATTRKYERERDAAGKSFTISIPEQKVHIVSEQLARHSLALLRSIGVRGTYRVNAERE